MQNVCVCYTAGRLHGPSVRKMRGPQDDRAFLILRLAKQLSPILLQRYIHLQRLNHAVQRALRCLAFLLHFSDLPPQRLHAIFLLIELTDVTLD